MLRKSEAAICVCLIWNKSFALLVKKGNNNAITNPLLFYTFSRADLKACPILSTTEKRNEPGKHMDCSRSSTKPSAELGPEPAQPEPRSAPSIRRVCSQASSGQSGTQLPARCKPQARSLVCEHISRQLHARWLSQRRELSDRNAINWKHGGPPTPLINLM